MALFTALAIGGIALSAYGQWRAGRASKKAGEAQQEAREDEAQLAEYNASVAQLQADDAIARGAEEESRFRESIDVMVGSQRAGFAGANVDVGFGSAVDVQADTRYLGELDALTIRTNAAREAWGFKVQREDLTRRAAIARKTGEYQAAAGREAATQSYLGIASTVVGGTTSLMQARYGMTNPKA
jgi:hypothetical protein